MKTRRKSKTSLAATHDSDDAHAEFFVHIPEDIDTDSLSDILPDIDFSSPSPEAIANVYRILLNQALEGRSITQELDEARAEIEKKEVELDQALQDKESVSKDCEAQVESIQRDLAQVKQGRDQLVASQTTLQDQITELLNSRSSSSSEVDALKHRVDDTEREKRDLVGVITRLKQESAHQEEEIQTLRANLKEARQDHQEREAKLRELRSMETSTKFKIDSLEQQLRLSQAEADRTNTELASKTEEFSKYRRTKHAEITTLQASFDSLTQTHNSSQASFKSLQSSYNNQAHNLTQALTKVQDLTGQLAEQETTFASEANGLRRLVAMMEDREKQAKEIVDGIEKEWAEVGEKSEQREAALKDEMERERKHREVAEKRAEQLEGVLNRMGRGELPLPFPGTPGTPLRTPGASDAMTDAMMGLSPTVAIASKAQKSGKTFTEVYADYVRLQDEYAKKCAEYDHMDRTLASVLGQIEERAPILSQQRAEYERLQSEASQLASQLAQALSERDLQGNIAAENAQKLVKSAKENELLQKQLEDLGRQVQGLLREISRRDDPTIPSDEDLDTVAVAPAEDTEAVITNNLVLFRSIGGLQDQNQKLLKIVREMGRKMESEEREYKDAMEREQAEAIKEAHEAIQEMAAQMERQKKSNEGIIQAYVKERDALRAMLGRVEKAGVVVEQQNTDPQDTDIAKELAETQTQFEAYRKEMGIDSSKLRDDLTTSQREIGQLAAALAKANAKNEFMIDRHRMDQDQLAMHVRDLDDLTKRNQQLYDQWTRIDIECTRATEDLQTATARTEQLRNECANLRAEKKIWESVQTRLVDENRTLALERSHLSDLMVNVQKMHNDLERSGENDRRRLENQLQMLEGQTQDLRTQLSQERDNIRHLNLQKDIEVKEFQNRFEKTAQEFSKTREDLVEAQTSKKHLEERVEELTRQLRGNEEKLAVYERRSTSGRIATEHPDSGLSQEQQLETEVAELRSSLKVAEVDLATARSHVEQFKEISQANEQALANMNATYDEYRASTEAQIARLESECQALKEKLQDRQLELGIVGAKYNDLQKILEVERTAWANDKKVLEDTIVDLSTSEKHSESDRVVREEEVHLQEQRAKAAEDRYANEVIAHANSIKTIESLKRDLSATQTTARDNLNAAETAKANLAASESSWLQQRTALDKEVADLNARCKDLTSQNAILHQHLESVSSQANRIKVAASSTTTTDVDATDDSETKLSELRSVVAYLRREKEIVDLQLELNKQTISRQKGEIERLSKDLNDTRQTLSEEREKAVETAASAAQHAELLERINQLNILRESNATLRADSENHARKSRELEAKLKQLSQELDPAKEKSRIAQAELEACKAQLTRLEDESHKWQERNSQLLSKYDRIDPAEFQALRDEIEQLRAHKIAIEQQKIEIEQLGAERQATIETSNEKVATLEKSIQNLKDVGIRNLNIFRNKMGKADSDLKTFTEEKATLEARIVELEKITAAAQAIGEGSIEAGPSSEEFERQAATIAALQDERDKLIAEKVAWVERESMTAPAPAADEAANLWQTEKAALEKARDEALAKLKSVTEEAQQAIEESRDSKLQSEKFQARISSLMKAKAAEDERQEIAEKAKAEAQNSESSILEEARKRHADELRGLEAKLTAKHEEELKAAVEAARKENPAPVATPSSDDEARIAAAIAEHKASLEAQQKAEVEAAIESGRMEQVAKSKLKDAQLVRTQKKVKDLETQILEWRNAGLLPDASGVIPSPITSSAVATPRQTSTGSNTTPTVLAARKPSVVIPTAPAVSGAGRGMGASRGRAVQRAMGAVSGSGRGATPPTAQGPAPTAPAAPAGGMSIIGAAAKRPRESEVPDDSLMKRLKPAETTAKNPVTIRRPGPPPS